MVIVLIILISAVSLSGMALTTDAFWGSDAMEFTHSLLADALAICVAVHTAGVIVMSFWHRENLIGSMITGQKHSGADQ